MKNLTLTNTVQTQEDKNKQCELQKSGEIPEHIAIIMDGNGRWARSKGSIRLHGHKVGVDSVRILRNHVPSLG